MDLLNKFSKKKLVRGLPKIKLIGLEAYKSIGDAAFIEFEKLIKLIDITRKRNIHEFSAPRTAQQNGVVERKNRVLIRPILDKTPYELLKKKRPKISYLKIFCSKCFVLKIIGNDGKFDAKFYEAIFLGYSMNSKTYRVYNLSKHIVEESIDVTFQEPNNDLPRDEEDDGGE
ncbi:hypothetical protein AgCh_028309 [Apium graveolens]